MKKNILFAFITITLTFMNVYAYSQNTDMPPKIVKHNQLPMLLEGYTVNIGSKGKMQLYDAYSNEPAKNIYNQGGIRIEISELEHVPDYESGKNFDSQRQIDEYKERFKKHGDAVFTNNIYKLHIKVTSGGSFGDEGRMPKDISGPVSQIIMHLPSDVKVLSEPVITVDGITQSEQRVRNLISIASFKLPGLGSAAGVFTEQIVGALKKAATSTITSSAYSTYKPSEVIEVQERVNFGESKDLQEITWVLGGYKGRDMAKVKTAEITLPLLFENEGNFDFSFFFNIWGSHSIDAPSHAFTTSKGVSPIRHSFRQHVVLSMEVKNESPEKGIMIDAEEAIYFKNPRIVQKASSEIIENNNTPENPKNIQLKYSQDTQKNITVYILQSREGWRGWNHQYENPPKTVSAAGMTISYFSVRSSGYKVFLTSGMQNRWQAYALLENNIVTVINGPGSNKNNILKVIDNLDLNKFASILNDKTR